MRGFVAGEGYSMGRIVKRASGWYFQCCVEVKEKKPIKKAKKVVGIDLGIKNFIVDSDKKQVDPPRFFNKLLKEIANKQRSLDKKKKGSKRRQKAIQILTRTHEKIGNQRTDFLHKVSRGYADKYALVAVEKLDVKGMMDSYFSRYIQDSAWDKFTQLLSYKLKMLGKVYVEVNPSYTTQECNKCGKIVKKSLSIRTHICDCGFVVDRDYNAALNIIKKARAELSV